MRSIRQNKSMWKTSVFIIIVLWFSYLEKNHSRHCIPSSVSNGLSDMPQDYIYLDGKRTEQKTNKTLPTGEVINSSKIYEHSLSYFTTMSLKPKQIYDLGYQQVEKLYPQVGRIWCSHLFDGYTTLGHCYEGVTHLLGEVWNFKFWKTPRVQTLCAINTLTHIIFCLCLC